MSKVVLNLYGGPGSGKSTTAAHLFALLKMQGVNTELVTKYVKNWVWEGRRIRRNDQYYILAKQARLESLKYGEVEVIITDSPVWLSAIYEAKFERKPHISQLLIDKHVQLGQEMGFEHRHVFLRRCAPYVQRGRYQTEEEAKQIDQELLTYLNRQEMAYLEYTANGEAAHAILRDLGY